MTKSFSKKYDLSKKNAIITGSCGLLGIEHSIALLELGAKVVMTDIDPAAYEKICNRFEGYKGSVSFYEMDITSAESIIAVRDDLRQKGTEIDILINNAAINPKFDSQFKLNISRVENYDLDLWNKELAVGLTGPLLCSKYFGQKMAENSKGGVILNIASDLSVISPDNRLYKKNDLVDNQQFVKPISYSVIKHGLIGMTKYISTYWASKNIRCNALSPGGVFTDHDDEFVKRISQLIPMGRMAERDEYRAAVQFLCSDASSYMNGQNIIMDGGRSVW
jgi:NAD(P)-dependent dehydrogenase (short-subunit alcohol dehydrogenase family)